MTTSSLPVQHISQSPQAGGYVLLSVTLAVEPAFLSYRYALGDITATLFDAQANRLQLLSATPIHADLLNAPQLLHLQSLENTRVQSLAPQTQQATLWLAADEAMGALFYEARQYAALNQTARMALLHASQSFAFAVKPARFMVAGLPNEAIGACPLLEDWKIPNRLSSPLGLPGCYDGTLPELFALWLENEQRQRALTENPPKWRVRAFLPNALGDACWQYAAAYPWLQFESVI